MRRSLSSLGLVAFLAASPGGCANLLGYESDYEVRGANAGGGGASGGAASGGSAGALAGSSAGGGAGGRTGGAAGIPAGGSNAGTSGAAGAPTGGSSAGTSGAAGGTLSVGGAGNASGGGAGTPSGGGAGNASGGAQAVGGTTGGGPFGGGGSGGGASGSAGGGGVSGTPTDCSVLYVAPTGDDDNAGCAPDKPKRSPAAALGGTKPNTKDVWICDGVYEVAALTLAKNVSLRGSYACGTWGRPPWPADAPRTRLEAAAGQAAALLVSGTEVTRGAIIEGLEIRGQAGTGPSRGLWITKGAAPTVRQNTLVGGATDSTGLGSLGAVLGQGAAPLLEGNLILGGTGRTTGNAVASGGLYLESDTGLADIVGNRIRAGAGTVRGAGLASVGLYVEALIFALEGTHALRENVIESSAGRDELKKAIPLSVAVALQGGGTAIELRGGRLVGGEALIDGAAADPNQDRSGDAAGIHSRGHKRLRLDHVRIYGGDATALRGGSVAITTLAGETVVVSSLLHAGGARLPTSDTRGIAVTDGASVELLGSTLLTGHQTGNATTPGGSKSLYAYGKVKAVLRSNLIVQQSGYAPGIQMDIACGLAEGSVLEANAFAYTRQNDPIFQQTRDDCPLSASTVAEAEAAISGSSKNLRVSPGNGAAPDIQLDCGNADACLAKLLSTYDAPSHGLSQVLSPLDEELSPRLPALCRLAIEGVLIEAAKTDLLGKVRPASRVSMGAFQVGGSLCAP